MTKEKQQFLDMVQAAERIAVSTHMRPDGDALGSSGAMYHWLRSKGKEAIVVLSDPAPDTVKFIHEGVCSVSFRENPEEAEKALKEADLIIATDYNVLGRSGEAESSIRASKAPKALFDHHIGPDKETFSPVFSREEVSSACEIVYEQLKDEALPAEAARCLMAGMTTDTNNFANSVYPGTLQMASELIAAGVDRDAIINELYNRYRPNRVKAFAWFLSNKLTLRPNGIASIIITRKEWHDFGLLDGELEGLVNIPLSIDEVKMVVYLRQDPEKNFYHCSLRSKKGWSANRMAVDHFHGGGHENASGGRLYWPEDISAPEDALAYIDNLTI